MKMPWGLLSPVDAPDRMAMGATLPLAPGANSATAAPPPWVRVATKVSPLASWAIPFTAPSLVLDPLMDTVGEALPVVPSG